MARHPLPSHEELAGAYQTDSYFEGETYPNWEHDPTLQGLLAARLRRIEERRSGPGRLLDVGCGLGHFLKLARARGWEATGTEVSAVAAAHARQIPGVRVLHGPLQRAGLSSGAFDVVCFWDVLEHLPEPREALREAHRLLRPGGLLAVSMPSVGGLKARLQRRRWRYFRPEFGHVMHYAPATLSRMLEETEFRVASLTTEGFFNLAALARVAPSMWRRSVIRRVMSCAQGPLDRAVGRLGLGENMMALAHRIP